MSRTIKKDTVYVGERYGEVSVVPDPRAACHVRGQYSGLVSASGIKAVRWVSRGTEAGWRVPMPSSRRDGSEGKWMCPPFLTQAKATQASLQCGTEGLSPATLIPMILIQNPPTLRLLRELTN